MLAVLFGGTLSVQPAMGQCQSTELQSVDLRQSDEFGSAVALSGDFALIGAPKQDGASLNSGSVYVFRREDAAWVENAKLTASDAGPEGRFGWAVGIDGMMAVVGAPFDNASGPDSGSAFAYHFDGTKWIEDAKLVAPDGAAKDYFGRAVAISGGTILVGAFTDDTACPADPECNSGSVYIFRRKNDVWAFAEKLVAEDASAGDQFGSAVSIDHQSAIIGAKGADHLKMGCPAGAAYVFRFDGSDWIEEIRLVGSDTACGDRFGEAVSVSGDAVIVGAWAADNASPGDPQSASGAAYIFRHHEDQWTEEAKLLRGDIHALDHFGDSVAIDGDWAVVGAPRAHVVGQNSGSVEVFNFDGAVWTRTAVLVPTIDVEQADFGKAVAIDLAVAVVGAPGTDTPSDGVGAAYVFGSFDLPDCDSDGIPDACESDCNANGEPDDCEIAAGTTVDCDANGVPDECQPLLTPQTCLRSVIIASGLEEPVGFASPPGDFARSFVLERPGRIRLLKNSALLEDPYLDISPLVGTSGEGGLLGLAFHPEYAQNGAFFVNYTDLEGDTVVARYTVSDDPEVANPRGVVLLQIPQPSVIHNGGCLAFRGDGFLYVGMGDGGDGSNSQDPQALLGKMLRIDVSGPTGYTVPPSNPFIDDPDVLDEIWAFGLRNPWRFSFDRLTGDLYIGDVGQSTFEEIDYEPSGARGGLNYGWRCMEGLSCFPNQPCECPSTEFTDPIFQYPDPPGEVAAVIGGYVYRGCAAPDLQGTYFFADWAGEVWSFRFDGEALTDFTRRTEALTPARDPLGGITTYGEDAAGELYLCEFSAGTISKMVPYATTGDFDLDGDVDISDFALMQECLAGPDPSAVDPCCRRFDFDRDADVDLADVARFWAALTDP